MICNKKISLEINRKYTMKDLIRQTGREKDDVLFSLSLSYSIIYFFFRLTVVKLPSEITFTL
ncbi:hypothetical protein M2135_001606 [Parabacteroides sp. PF5-9]|nr:hypothetical protein [Parabacteroides sp. PF5-9]